MRMNESAVHLYLDLMKRCLLNTVYCDASAHGAYEEKNRLEGRDWPHEAHTMIGLARLTNLEELLTNILRDQVPGDIIETGAWRGGASIFMRAVLKAHAITDRTVWVADSFEGLPPPDPKYPADAGDQHHTQSALKVSLPEVQRNFQRYNLLDTQVQFLKGWFRNTLPEAPIEKLALLRLDGDMYGSTIEALTALYPKVEIGGYVVVDDFGSVRGCRAAVEAFRGAHKIRDPIIPIDWTGVYWRRVS